jgi:MFS family permease
LISALRGSLSTRWPRAFVALWLGQTVSSVGSQMSLVAIPLLAALVLHAGPIEMAVLGALETAPFVIVSLPAGVIADRRDRRRLLIACDVWRAVAMGSIPIVFLLGFGSFAWLCLTAVVVGSLSALFTVAQQAYVPDVVAVDQLVMANQRLEISESGARVAGPGLAGAVFQIGGGLAAVGLDAISYVLSALSIRAGGRPPTTGSATPTLDDASTREAIVTGVRHVWRDPTLRYLMLSTAVFNLATGMMLAQLVLYATHDLAVDPAGFGLFQGMGNVGFLVGALVIGRLERRIGPGRLMLYSTCLGSLALWMIAVAGFRFGFVLLLAGRFTGAVSAPLFNVMLVTMRQARSPERLRARVAATFRTIDWATAPIGALISGVIGAVAGVPAVMLVAAVVGTASIPWLLAGAVRRSFVTEPSQAAAGLEPGLLALDPGVR